MRHPAGKWVLWRITPARKLFVGYFISLEGYAEFIRLRAQRQSKAYSRHRFAVDLLSTYPGHD